MCDTPNFPDFKMRPLSNYIPRFDASKACGQCSPIEPKTLIPEPDENTS